MSILVEKKSELSFLGGDTLIEKPCSNIFTWPIVTKEHEESVLSVLRRGEMSGWDVTKEFENQYARKLGRDYGLAYNNGTGAILGGLWAMGVKAGDEVIVPSLTYWASVLPLYSLGATPVFADVEAETLCIDPQDIERKITSRTKAIIVVHYAATPAKMDAILEIARKHGLKVMEDCSHAHGALYKGKEVGTFGDTAAFSLMSGKSFAIGEGGILFTDDIETYDRAILFGHYERHCDIETEELKPYIGIPCGGFKHRMHQLSSAFGLVQLKLYPQQMAEIDKAMNYFCDLLEEIPGLEPIRPEKDSGSTKGGWYASICKYNSDVFDGLSLSRFAAAVRAEGSICDPGCNKPLHLHPVFKTMDIYGQGRPTRVANLPAGLEVSEIQESLPVTEAVNKQVFFMPWFKHFWPETIQEFAAAYKKVAQNYKELLEGDAKTVEAGGFSSSFRKK